MKLKNNLEELVDQLLTKFPNRLPRKPNEDLSRLIGQQDVIQFIMEVIEKQQGGTTK